MITLTQFNNLIKGQATNYFNMLKDDLAYLEKNEEFLKECVNRGIIRNYASSYELKSKYYSFLNGCINRYTDGLSRKVLFDTDTLKRFFNTGDFTILDDEITEYYNNLIKDFNLLYTIKNNSYKKKAYDSYNYSWKIKTALREFCFIMNIPFDDDFRIDERKEFDYLNIHIKVYKNDNIEFKIKA